MYFDNVSVLSLAYVDPPHAASSASIEAELSHNMQRFGMRPNLIEGLTGIRERRWWDPGTQPSEVATLAAARALEAAALPPTKVGVLISSSVCKDYIEPAVAALVHGNLKLPATCLNFDVGNACLAFLNAMTLAGNMIERGQCDYALIVDAESSRELIEQTVQRLKRSDCDPENFRAQFASLTLGSAAVAMVLAHSRHAACGHRFFGGVSLADTNHSRLCLGHAHEMRTDASALLKAGIQLASRTWQAACEQMAWQNKRFAQYIVHQVGETHLRKLAEALGLPQERIFKTYPEYGNVGPASIPLTLAKAAEAGLLPDGERVALMGIGSGINCAMMELLW